MDVKQRVITAVLNHLPSAGGDNSAESSLEFFLNPSEFPIGNDLGSDRESWKLGFTWMDGLGGTAETVDIIYFDDQFKRSDFKGIFRFPDKDVQILGDFDPPRGLNPQELEFLKSQMPDVCRIFLVGVYRPSTTRKTRKGLPALGLDGLVVYWTNTTNPNRRVPNPLQRLATPAPSAPVPSAPAPEPVQNGTPQGKNFVKKLLS